MSAPHISQFVGLCLKQRGDDYVFGHEVSLTDPDPETWDCSELVQWAAAQCGVKVPDGSYNQKDFCEARGLLIPIQQGVQTQGALGFVGASRVHHVAVMLGNGNTIEARGHAYGVGSWSAVKDRHWDYMGLIPGFTYGHVPPAPPRPRGSTAPAHPQWPGRYLTQPPVMRGGDVHTWQQRMAQRGWRLKADGAYGDQSEAVCRAFQKEKGLKVDGIVGRDTWDAAWTAKVT